MKKILALMLALSLIVCLFAGCGSTAETPEETPTETPTETPAEGTETEAPAEAETPAYMLEMLDAMNTYAEDTVVMTVDGQEITWDLFYYMVAGALSEYAYYMGDLPGDFSMEVVEGTTMEDYFNQMAVEQCKLLGAVLAKAKAEGVIPAAETEEEILAGWEEMAAAYGGEEAVRELSFLTREAYLAIMRFDLGNSGIQTKMYGAAGELFPEEDVIAWAEENQFVKVKHILYKYEDADGNALDEAGKADVLAKAEAVQEELKALEGDKEALEARFDEIMNADSADKGGLMSFPDGYTFTTGYMVKEYEDMAFSLEEYEVSEPVESTYGIHILLRLPMDPDAVPVQKGNSNSYTLRQMAISQEYNEQMKQWIADAQIEWAEDFGDFTVQNLFPDRVGSGTMVKEG